MTFRSHLLERLRGLTGSAQGMTVKYGIAAGLWIAMSDAAIVALVGARAELAVFLALKGLLAAAVTALVLYAFLQNTRSSQAEMHKELYLALHDPATNLFRRAEWIRRVDSLLREERVPREPAVVLTVIVNRYDYLVHRYGFEKLNELLTVFGRRLRVMVRADDMVGCVSPAVFVIYMHGIGSRKQAMEIVEPILETGKRTFLVGEEPVTLNLDVGLCAYPEDGDGAEELLARANIAMRRAISEGLNKSCWYSPEMAERVITRVSLEKELERALDREELRLYFQPRVSLKDSSVCGFEALVRWEHPQRGLIPPAVFIGVAEDSGLIIDIGRWVLGQSVAFLRDWAAAGLPNMNVSVNVSNAQLTRSNFLKDIDAALGDTPEFASALELELTESLAMSDPQLTMQVLRQVKAAGMRVALDDFGTGYSSLSYLQRFPIDCLKIDRSFIVDLIESHHSQELTKTVIALGHSLGAQVLAEGVETLAQVRMLSEYGCDEAQGFYYGQPVPGPQLLFKALEERPEAGTARILRPPPFTAVEPGVALKGVVHVRN